MRRRRLYLLIAAALMTSTILVLLQIVFVPQYGPVDYKKRRPIGDDSLKNAFREVPNLPERYFNKMPSSNEKTRSCASYPKIVDITFSGDLWQTLNTNGGVFYLFGTYSDERQGDHVRIIALHDQIDLKTRLYCQFWYENHDEPIVTEITDHKIIWYEIWGNYKGGFLQPYLITCPVNKDLTKNPPESLSLVESPCQNATNNLKIHRTKSETKKNFAVCVKGLNYLDDLSTRLIEWIELLFILGVDKIFFYKYLVGEKTERVLDHYQKLDLIGVRQMSVPGTAPNHPLLRFFYLKERWAVRRRLEVIAYNDCLYQNINDYRYLVLLDIDEVILPLKVPNWGDLVKTVELQDVGVNGKKSASYLARNVYFFDDTNGGDEEDVPEIPNYMHMLKHVYRSRNHTKPRSYVKCFHDTTQVVTLHNHLPMHCINTNSGRCQTFGISTDDAQLQHYRSDCVGELKNTCEYFRKNPIRDTNIWRYKEKLIGRTEEVLKDLGMLDDLV